MNISYEESLEIRGIAILMMLWLHCFCNWSSPEYTYISYIWLGGYPLPYRLTYIAGVVVPLYCFLSGYGLCKKHPFNISYLKTKIQKLFCQYWLVLVIFLALSLSMDFSYYNLSISSLLGNFVGYDTSYNRTLWFLLPYILLFISCPILFRLLSRKNIMVVCLSIILVLFVLANWVLKLEAQGKFEYSAFIILIANYFKMLFPFSLGFIAAFYPIPNSLKILIEKRRLLWLFVLGIVLLSKLFIPSYTLNYFYLIPGILFWHLLDKPLCLKHLLVKFGKKSTYIWFVHGYFTYYIFHPYIFCLKYPIFIFMGVLLVSYGLSFLFDYIYTKLSSLKLTR